MTEPGERDDPKLIALADQVQEMLSSNDPRIVGFVLLAHIGTGDAVAEYRTRLSLSDFKKILTHAAEEL